MWGTTAFLGYWYPFRKTNPRGVPGRQNEFQPETSLELIVALYEFDRQLRLQVMNAVERVEVALRVDIGHRLGKKHPQAHEDPQYLDGKFARLVDNRTGQTRYAEWFRKMSAAIENSKDEFVKHHTAKYGGKMPIWVATELWDFGQLSKFFSGMNYNDQGYVAKRYGLTDTEGLQLASWIRAISLVRNISAHHGRLWNRNIADRPSFPVTQNHHHLHHIASNTHAQTRIYGVLCILQKMLKVISPGDSWAKGLKTLCETFPESTIVTLADAGFPEEWHTKGLWA